MLTTATKNRSDKEMIRAFTDLTEDLKRRGIYPGFHFMDNEAYTALKTKMTSMNIKYQLEPQRNNRANNAERSIQTFKNHFIAGLCSVEKYFHLKLRDRLLQQAAISLNKIIQSRTLTHLSAYTHIFGEFDLKCTQLAPPGTQVVINHRPNDCASKAPHEEYICYIGT